MATPELIMAYLARPELMPPADACDAERDLHASLMADPLRAGVGEGHRPACRCRRARKLVLHDEFSRPADGGAVAGGGLCRAGPKGAGDLPPIFLSQLCHLILRNALEGCDDPYILRAAELFYRSQLAAVHDGTLLLADAEVIEAEQHAQHDLHSSPLTAMLQQPKSFGEMDVMDDENAWTYWSRSDAHAMAMNLGGNAKARAGLCRVIERWIGHLLGVTVSVETIASIEDRDWRWFIGLDSEATRIGNALWRGERLEAVAERIVALMRLSFEDTRLVDERVGDKPVYLILAMGADKVVRLKPQNLIAGLPLAAAANVT